MTFEEWWEIQLGKTFSVEHTMQDACKMAWDAAQKAEREACLGSSDIALPTRYTSEFIKGATWMREGIEAIVENRNEQP